MSKPLIFLASGSPRRGALLRQIGLPHRARAVAIDETPQPAESPGDYVVRLASEKADALWRQLDAQDRLPVLGSDTAVVIDAQILGKPAGPEEAARMLQRLSGRAHQVYTGVALRDENQTRTRLNVSEVEFGEIAADQLEAYCRSGEPADKAGAYAIQGRAALFVVRLHGSYSGVMGLPLFETGELLREAGLTLPDAGVRPLQP